MVTILLSMLYLTFLDMELLSKNVSIMTFIKFKSLTMN